MEAAGADPRPQLPEDSMEVEDQKEVAALEAAGGSAAAGGGTAALVADDEEDEKICRYCFDGEEYGELLAPCDCSGGQKWVHLSCLRRWQRMVLVTQPTHPRFWRDDVRQHQCNVCKAEFTCTAPSRHELMESFTGPELAALIEPGCVIGAHKVFSAELASQLESLPPMARFACGYEHWIGGCYLITSVTADDGEIVCQVDHDAELDQIRGRLGDELSITIEGTELTLQAKGSLEGVPEGQLGARLVDLRAPCQIVLGDNKPKTCGDDSVCALNLTRPISSGNPNFNARELEKSLDEVRSAQSYGEQAAAGVLLEHYDGGPVEAGTIVTCVVVGGSSTGWSTTDNLTEAVLKAYCRAAKRADGQGGPWLASGQTVRLQGLLARPDLNDEIGIAIRYSVEKGRWLVKLQNGEGKMLKPANLGPAAWQLEESSRSDASEYLERPFLGRVLVAWGDARWSRTQLLGEIARGHWGLGKASVCELTTGPSQRWSPGLDHRLCFSPVTEMTEDFMRSAERQMDKERQAAEREGEVGQGAPGRAGDDNDDDDDTASVVGGITPRGSSP